ncbi:histidine phosphatase family protein [Marisediminicola sp. LYQ85]|uniref:histidine phosphatase family protein n=1 Tax=Marisediminicola sp. LYQ85 TaxID=3391062 RepID=UPI00398384A2
MRLLLIRHGQTPSNVDGLLDTSRPGAPLTGLGEQQAAAIPEALAGQRIDHLVVSPLLRTHLTAAPLAADRGLEVGTEVPVVEGLEEIGAGSLEMRNDPEAHRAYLEAAFAWGAGDRDVSMPGGDDGHAFFERFDRAVREAIAGAGAAGADSDTTVAIVSHGAAIRVWVAARADNIHPSFTAENDLPNTGIVTLEGSFESGWTLVDWLGTPVGGAALDDPAADDFSGETLDEVESDAHPDAAVDRRTLD